MSALHRHGALLIVILTMVANIAKAQEIEEGVWVLEIQRSDAPLDIRKIEIKKPEGNYTVTSSNGSLADSPIENLSVDKSAIVFDMRDIMISCRLEAQSVEPLEWLGPCPPDANPEAPDSVVVRMRTPDGPAKEPDPFGVRVIIEYKGNETLSGELTVYVVARALGNPPPLAVQQIPFSALPLELELTDSAAMISGSKLSSAAELEISAHISRSGSAKRNSGDWQGIGVYEPESDQYRVVIDQLK